MFYKKKIKQGCIFIDYDIFLFVYFYSRNNNKVSIWYIQNFFLCKNRLGFLKMRIEIDVGRFSQLINNVYNVNIMLFVYFCDM